MNSILDSFNTITNGETYTYTWNPQYTYRAWNPQAIIKELDILPLKNIKEIQVKSIRFDKKFTTVTWNDNTTTRVGCMLEDEYNRYEAFCAALAKRIYGSTSSVKHIVDTKDEQIEIDKQRKEREAQEKTMQIRKARKDRIWIKKRAKEIVRENAAQELAKKMLEKK